MKRLPLLFVVVFSVFSLLLVQCSRQGYATNPGTGTGSETTNGFSATIRHQDGSPASYAVVKLLPKSYLKDTSQNYYIMTVTDSDGFFKIESLSVGDYIIEVVDTGSKESVTFKAKTTEDTIVQCGIVFVNPVGSITGGIVYNDIPETTHIFVMVFGLDKRVEIDHNTGRFTIDSMASGFYSLRIVSDPPLYMPYTFENVRVGVDSITTLDVIKLAPVNAWGYTKQIYLNTTSSGANIGKDVCNFPVLIRLTKDNFKFSEARPNGDDIRFAKVNNNTPLSYQIERFDVGAQEAEIWVKIDTVYANNTTQSFVMHWGNADAISEGNGSAVFDTSIGFEGVWHMNDVSGNQCLDATGNKYNGKWNGPDVADPVAGSIGLSQKFNGKSRFLVLSNSANSQLNFKQDAKYTLSAWVYAEALDNDFHAIISKGNYQYSLQLDNGNTWENMDFQNKAGWNSTGAPATAKKWQYVVGVRNGKKQYIYVDGNLIDSTITNTAGTSARAETENVCFGRRAGNDSRYFNGMIDEIRMSSWPNGQDWIRLCYMNQKAVDALVYYK